MDLRKWLLYGRRVVDRNGCTFMVIDNALVAMNGFTLIDDLTDDLIMRSQGDEEWDVMKVYERPDSDKDLINLNVKGGLIWERQDDIIDNCQFEKLIHHVGHDIECVKYLNEDKAVNVSIECVTCHEVLSSVDRTVELELTDEMIQRNDIIDNSVFACICDLAEESLEWDMQIIGEVTDAIVDVLNRFDIKVRHPGITTDEYGKQYYEE